MAKLGYWQECQVLRCSQERTVNDHGKEVTCVYLECDISARDSNSGTRLNIRYLCVRVLNKKIRELCEFLEYPVMARMRLYASGYRTRENANRRACAIDVYELIILDDNDRQEENA